MASLKDIRRRISSVKNTRKITYAMKLVSAAKLKRSQEAVVRSREYTSALLKIVQQLGSSITDQSHPLMEARPVKVMRIIVLGANRGLCGGYNANLNRKLLTILKEEEKGNGVRIELIILGKKPAEGLRRVQHSYEQSFEDLSEDPKQWPLGETLADGVNDFLEGKIDKVCVLYTKFRSAISMTPTLEELLPVPQLEVDSSAEAGQGAVLFEPSAKAMFEALVPRLIRAQLQQASFDAKTSEYGARMTAMDAATRNAGDLIKSLTLTANKLRQSGITAELLDIIGGAEAIA